jgi:hypothetical protein
MVADDIARFIESNSWAFAKTMPQDPHWYVVRSRCDDEEAFEEFVMHIREHGYLEMFEGREYTYFDIGEFKYWTMGSPLEVTTIINRAEKQPRSSYM